MVPGRSMEFNLLKHKHSMSKFAMEHLACFITNTQNFVMEQNTLFHYLFYHIMLNLHCSHNLYRNTVTACAFVMEQNVPSVTEQICACVHGNV